MGMILAGVDCENCAYGSIDESDKARLMVYCQYKDKTYYYGQCIPCDSKTKRIKDDKDGN